MSTKNQNYVVKINAPLNNQLDQLFQLHQIFNSGNTVQKGQLFKNLSATSQSINEQNVTMVELDLISSHSGGK